ncbi:ABC transporter substrate-binding protein [Comamonas serinivorans]|nr:ABC transporter substrate-binding protein [Comamonas serinivorans]
MIQRPLAVLALLASFTAHANPVTLSVALSQDPPSLDPLRIGSYTERQFAMPVYEALFAINPQGQPVPHLATSYTVSDDLKTWRFTLRDGVKFHDGTPLDAAAVVANLARAKDPANRCRCTAEMETIAGFKAIDGKTVEITLNQPNAVLPVALAGSVGTMASPTAFKADPASLANKPVGTGPFRFVEWIKNSRYVLEKNPDYWQQGKPQIDRLVLRGMQNTEPREAAFKSGQVDIVLQPSRNFIAQEQRTKTSVVYATSGPGTEGVYFNGTKPPLDDLNVRKAVAHALDRDLLVKTLGFGLPTLAYSPFGPTLKVAQPIQDYPAYDPAKAKALVAAYGKPVQFKFIVTNRPETRLLGQSIQQMLQKVGMQVELVPLDENRMIQSMVTKDFEASAFKYSGASDPHYNVYAFYYSKRKSPSQYGSFVNARVDALIEQGMSTRDPATRAAVYSELAKVLATDVMPIAYTYNSLDLTAMKKNVKGYTHHADALVRFGDLRKE